MTGLRDASPIILAYFPISVTFGVLATSHGLAWLVTCLISLCVYAGSAQFMMVSLVATGVPPVSFVVTILLVNLRHFLYGTTLGPAFLNWSDRHRFAVAFGLTDEVYAVTSARGSLHQPTPVHHFVFTFACYLSWVLGTVVGASIGSIVPQSIANVLSFALPALFLALLAMGERSFAHLVAAMSGAVIAIVLNLLRFGSIAIVAGAVIGAVVGVLVRAGSTKIRSLSIKE